jgi:arylsulfatase A-like enzyme
MIDRYDGEIWDNDRGFGEFLALLRSAGRDRNAIIILVADHGESFLEHGVLQHGLSLSVSEMHIPLIIRFPDGKFAGERIKERVSLIDLFPTLIKSRRPDLRLPYPLPGIDLYSLAADVNPEQGRRASPAATRPLFAEVSKYEDNIISLVAVIDQQGYKRVAQATCGPRQVMGRTTTVLGLWDTQADPAEARDLSLARPVQAAYDTQQIAQWLLGQASARPAGPKPKPAALSEEQRRELKALGYLK